jgi:hypothetical protein
MLLRQKNFSALEMSSISQVWEVLYKKRNLVTLFRSAETYQTQSQGLGDYLIPLNEFCKQNSSRQTGSAYASCGKQLNYQLTIRKYLHLNLLIQVEAILKLKHHGIFFPGESHELNWQYLLLIIRC